MTTAAETTKLAIKDAFGGGKAHPSLFPGVVPQTEPVTPHEEADAFYVWDSEVTQSLTRAIHSGLEPTTMVYLGESVHSAIAQAFEANAALLRHTLEALDASLHDLRRALDPALGSGAFVADVVTALRSVLAGSQQIVRLSDVPLVWASPTEFQSRLTPRQTMHVEAPQHRSLSRSRPSELVRAKPSKAFAAFDDLRRWLRLGSEEAAKLIGVGRTTPLAWEREGHEPRPATARRLYQLHTLVSAIVERLGEPAAIRWLESGSPSPHELIISGQFAEAARSAEDVLIGRRPATTLEPGALIDESHETRLAEAVSTRRRGARRQRRRS